MRPTWRTLSHRLRAAPDAHGLEYWEQRARAHGARSVIDLRNRPGTEEAVRHRQLEILLPLLADQLRGDERVVLDFGCGPGRFTAELAERTGAQVIGVDPVQRLLDLAPTAPGVIYRRLEGGRIPLEDESADVVWACLVFGGIIEPAELRAAAHELRRVMRGGCLLFLVENTAPLPALPHWVYRSAGDYAELFSQIPLRTVGTYVEIDQTISVLAGRVPLNTPTEAQPDDR